MSVIEKLINPIYNSKDKSLEKRIAYTEADKLLDFYFFKFIDALNRALLEDGELQGYFGFQPNRPITLSKTRDEGVLKALDVIIYENEFLKKDFDYDLDMHKIENIIDELLSNKNDIYSKAKEILLNKYTETYKAHYDYVNEILSKAFDYKYSTSIIKNDFECEVKVVYSPQEKDKFLFSILIKNSPMINEYTSEVYGELKWLDKKNEIEIVKMLNDMIVGIMSEIQLKGYEKIKTLIPTIHYKDNVKILSNVKNLIISETLTKYPTIYLPINPSKSDIQIANNFLKATHLMDMDNAFLSKCFRAFDVKIDYDNIVYTNKELIVPYKLNVEMFKNLERQLLLYQAELRTAEFLDNEVDFDRLHERIVNNEELNLYLLPKTKFKLGENNFTVYHCRVGSAQTKKFYFVNGKKVPHNRFCKIVRKSK